MPKTSLISSLQIGVGAGLGSVLFQAIQNGINDIDYFRAITVGAVVALVVSFVRIGFSKKSSKVAK